MKMLPIANAKLSSKYGCPDSGAVKLNCKKVQPLLLLTLILALICLLHRFSCFSLSCPFMTNAT